MRSTRAIVALLLCGISSVAVAGTITSVVSYNGSADNGALLTGPLFNTSLGTLTGVDLAITGSYNPDLFFPPDQTNIPTESQLNYSLFGLNGSFGTYNLTLTKNASSQTLTGPAETFAIRADPTDLSDFLSPGGNHNGELGYINLFSTPVGGIWGGAFSNLSLYSGNVDITYTYAAIPEPPALLLSGVGLLSLLLVRRRWLGKQSDKFQMRS